MRFADGTVWTVDGMVAALLAATPGDDTITGFRYRGDVLDGGAGDDLLDGSSGANTYVFGKGYGTDRIASGAEGRIAFAASVSSGEVSLARVVRIDEDGNRAHDTVFSVAGTADALIVSGSDGGRPHRAPHHRLRR